MFRRRKREPQGSLGRGGGKKRGGDRRAAGEWEDVPRPSVESGAADGSSRVRTESGPGV